MAAVDLTKLTQQITTLTGQVTRIKGYAESVAALIAGHGEAIKAAVAAALQADDAADQGSVDIATAAIDEVTAGFADAADRLAAAIATESPAPPTT